LFIRPNADGTAIIPAYPAAMPTTHALLAFCLASIVLIEIPGPSLLFALGRALTVGRREALLSVLGNAAGLLVQVAAVAIGLGAVVAASATAFTVLKIIGGLYVAYLGVQAIRHRRDARSALQVTVAEPLSGMRALGTGLTVGMTTRRRSSSSWPSCRSSWRARTPPGHSYCSSA